MQPCYTSIPNKCNGKIRFMKKTTRRLIITTLILHLLINTAQANQPLHGHLKKGWQADASRDLAWILGEKAPFPQKNYKIHQLIIAAPNEEITARGTLDLISNQPNESIFKLRFFFVGEAKFKSYQFITENNSTLRGNITFSNHKNACLIAGKIIHDSPTTAHLEINKKKSTCPIQIQYKIDGVCDGLILTATEAIPLTIT